MQYQERESTTSAGMKIKTPEEIIHELLTSADMDMFEDKLHDMFLSFVREQDNPGREYLNSVIWVYSSLRNTIIDLKRI
jgi:hypothetical protein